MISTHFATALAGRSASLNPDAQKFLTAVQADLKKAGGRCVVMAGPQSSVACNAAALAVNGSMGAVGKTVVYTETVNPIPSEQVADLKSLIGDMNAGKVQWLVMLGANPLYNAPADLEFSRCLRQGSGHGPSRFAAR